MAGLSKRHLGFAVGIALAGVAVFWLFFTGRQSVHTENAYVKADKISLASEVAGTVQAVNVETNEYVHRGAVLVELDDTPFRIAVQEAEAQLNTVRNDLRAKRADHAEAMAALEQARRDADYYQRKLDRNEKLASIAVSESELDDARQALAQARARIAINTEKLSSLSAELDGEPEAPLEAHADLRVAQAQLDKARYQLSRTKIVAPVDGLIAGEVPQSGEMAVNGLTLITMMSTSDIWVEANLKETQLTDIREGQRAFVRIDAYPDRQWSAEVASLSPATGAEFALIPPQNASGNWVKVTQRVPVRLRLLDNSSQPPLRAGMSARVEIDTGNPGAYASDHPAKISLAQ